MSSSTTAASLGNDRASRPARAPARSGFGLILILFAASGATGLIDQLCFAKYLSYVVGSTAHAVSAVLAAFMAGLAIGAHFGGKLSTRVRRPLLAYGVLELVVAGAVALAPLAFQALTPAYVALVRAVPSSVAAVGVLRWLMAMSVVVVPTAAMGATLPLLSRAVSALDEPGRSSAPERERRLTHLYAINTLGGALGALLSAYVLLQLLGVAGTLLSSAAVSAAIGALAIAVGRANTSQAGPEEHPVSAAHAAEAPATSAPLEKRERWLLGSLALASGWLVFACEVVFTHLLALIIGNSAYAFGLILAAFLSCLFLGATQAARVARRYGQDALPVSLCAAGLALAITIPIWDKLPYIFGVAGELVQSFAGRELMRAVVAFAILFVPTTLMGLTFPLLLQRVAAAKNVGQLVGRLTALNTLGAVIGSLVTGYVVLPRLGSQYSLLAVALVFASLALLTPHVPRGIRRRGIVVASASTALLAALAPEWNPQSLTRGTNVYFDSDQAPGEVLSMHEDVHGGVTTVARREGVTTLYTNGKFQGNTGWEMNAQRYFAHYPELFVNRHDRALVIGLGTATTLGAIATYPWRVLDVAEISPAIANAARQYFRVPNRGVLDDPRVTIHHADGRNFLLVNEQRYDLISMELSSIWFAGASSLYSREFYRLARKHLADDGIFQQWVQLHHIRHRDFATILHTLRRELPHVVLFVGGGQGILVASPKPLRASRARLEAHQQRAGVRETIPDGRTLESLLGDVVLENASFDRFLNEVAAKAGEPLEALISTDDNLYLEYATPRGNTLPWSSKDELIAELRRYRDPAAIARLSAP